MVSRDLLSALMRAKHLYPASSQPKQAAAPHLVHLADEGLFDLS